MAVQLCRRRGGRKKGARQRPAARQEVESVARGEVLPVVRQRERHQRSPDRVARLEARRNCGLEVVRTLRELEVSLQDPAIQRDLNVAARGSPRLFRKNSSATM